MESKERSSEGAHCIFEPQSTPTPTPDVRRRIGKHRTHRGQISANVSSTKDTEAGVATGDAEEESSSDHKLKPQKLPEKKP